MTQPALLPEMLKLFPVRGCILPPGEHLPLNVFEPRYLNMVDDALAGDRFIGMIQPLAGGAPDKPALEAVGGAGRIVSHSETDDGRYLIVLEGVSRFILTHEADLQTPYRVGHADYARFEADLNVITDLQTPPSAAFLDRLKTYFDLVGIETDWDAVIQAPLSLVVNKTAMIAPFDPTVKQQLLEAPSVHDRARTLDLILRDSIAQSPSGLTD